MLLFFVRKEARGRGGGGLDFITPILNHGRGQRRMRSAIRWMGAKGTDREKVVIIIIIIMAMAKIIIMFPSG
jgi:hypothetical protein